MTMKILFKLGLSGQGDAWAYTSVGEQRMQLVRSLTHKSFLWVYEIHKREYTVARWPLTLAHRMRRCSQRIWTGCFWAAGCDHLPSYLGNGDKGHSLHWYLRKPQAIHTPTMGSYQNHVPQTDVGAVSASYQWCAQGYFRDLFLIN